MYTLRQAWIEARSSLWLVPSLIVVAAVVMAFGLIQLDEALDLEWLNKVSRLFGAGAEGSRGMLGAIATSMITVAGVTFSITIAALAQASSQYSPLVLRNFMRDRANQIVLGAFGGIFVYCLVVLRTIRSGPDEFIPTIAVSAALLHAVIGIGLLVFFVHHIASTLQASSILANIAASARMTLNRHYPLLEHSKDEDHSAEGEVVQPSDSRSWPVTSSRSGYVQDINDKAICDLAARHEALVRLRLGIGDFAVEGLPMADVHRDKPVDSGLKAAFRDAIIIGEFRTSERDLAFALRQIVDMAVKALSPGINDPTTAELCLYHLAAILADLGGRRMPLHVHRVDGKMRLLAVPQAYASLAELAFTEIRHHGRQDARVQMVIVAAIETAARRTSGRARRKVLLHQLELTAVEARRSLPDGERRQLVLERIEGARQIFAGISPRPDADHARARQL